MRRSTLTKVFGFGMVALSCGAVACAASGGSGGGNGGGGGGGGGLVSGDGGGGPMTPGSGGTTPGAGGTTPGVGGTTPGVGGTTNTPDGEWIDGAMLGIDFAQGAFDFGDTAGSTRTLKSPEPGKICLSGSAAGHGDSDYTKWGAGAGVKLAPDGGAFDAAALGINRVTFNLEVTTLPPGGVRVGLTMTADSENPFVLGGGTADLMSGGAQTGDFSDFTQPEWSTATLTFDASSLEALQFQAVSGSATGNYDFCVSNIEWWNGATKVTPDAGGGD